MKELIYHTKKNRRLLVAEEWNELTGKQLLQLARIRHSQLPYTDQLLRSLQIVSNKNILSYFLIPADARMCMLEHVKWVMEENTLTSQLIPKYRGLYGPDSNFENLRMHEFNQAEMAYYELVTDKDEDCLNQLIAVLYREPRKDYDHNRNADGDHRIPYLYGDISWYKKKIAKWPQNVKHAILLWYDGCRQQLVEHYPLVYPEKSSSSSGNMGEGLFGMIHSVAGDKYGTFDEVENSFVHKILMALNTMIYEAQQMEKNAKA